MNQTNRHHGKQFHQKCTQVPTQGLLKYGIPYRKKLPKNWLSAENFVHREFFSAKKFVRGNILSAEIQNQWQIFIWQNCRNFELVSNILSTEIFFPPKFFPPKFLSDKVFKYSVPPLPAQVKLSVLSCPSWLRWWCRPSNESIHQGNKPRDLCVPTK